MAALPSALPMQVSPDLAQMGQLLKQKMYLHAAPNNSTNRALNAEIHQKSTAVKGNPQFNALLASENLQFLWERLRTRTAEWVDHGEKVQEQALEASAMFRAFMATRGDQTTASGMKAVAPEGQAFVSRIGF